MRIRVWRHVSGAWAVATIADPERPSCYEDLALFLSWSNAISWANDRARASVRYS